MADDRSDFTDALDSLRERMIRAQLVAVRKLTSVARGKAGFRNDRELRACVALARLAPLMFRPIPEKPYNQFQDPDWWTEERKADFRILKGQPAHNAKEQQ